MEGYNLTRTKPFLSKHCFISSLLFTVIFILSNPLNAKVRNFQTTRMMSTGGAGVGSILLDEATLLNPASMGFYTDSSIYFQKGGMDITPDISPYRGLEPELMAFIGSDASRGTGGSISYTEQTENFDTRERLSVALASPMTKDASIGVSFRKTTDVISSTQDGLNYVTQEYNQFVFGVTHAMSKDFSLGLVVVDPFQAKPEDTLGTLGFQYVYKSISLIADIGANYNDDLAKSIVYKGALQVRVYNDFFVRFGAFNDKGKKEKGNGVGAGWAGPKLVFDVALKNTTLSEDVLLSQSNQSIRETSFSLSYKF